MKGRLMLTATFLCVLGGLTFLNSQTKPAEAMDKLTWDQALELVRVINTAELEISLGWPAAASAAGTKHAYAPLADLLKHRYFLQPRALVPVQLDSTTGSVKNYKLSVVASADGRHYLVGLVPSQPECLPALFTNESGVIYRATALGCK